MLLFYSACFFLIQWKQLLKNTTKLGIKSVTLWKVDLVHTNFHGGKALREGCQCICWSVIVNDSIDKMNENYYP